VPYKKEAMGALDAICRTVGLSSRFSQPLVTVQLLSVHDRSISDRKIDIPPVI